MTKHSSAFLFKLKNRTICKSIFNKFLARHKKDNLLHGPERQNIIANRILNYHYDCTKPRTFNEYLGWMKYNYRNDLWKRCADKIESKKFLAELGLEKYTVKILGIYKNSNEIILDSLPNEFVLKTNHDSGTVFICNKKNTDFNKVFMELDKSIKKRYENNNDEWVYESIVPLIFAEELLQPLKGNLIVDYKLFGFNGHYGWGFTGQNREKDTRFVVFEKDFEIQNTEYIYLKPKRKDMPSKPKHLEEMISITETISKILGFVRVDFFETTEGLKIGELTFFSQSGYGSFTRKEYDFKYGHLFKNVDFDFKKVLEN